MRSISFLIPTIGRSTLERAVESVASQLRTIDQLIVVGDGDVPAARDLLRSWRWPWTYYLEIPHVGDWGSSPIQHGVFAAKGDYLGFLGDDDYLLPGALNVIHEAIDTEERPSVHFFAIDYHGHREFPGWSRERPDTDNKVEVDATLDGTTATRAWISHCRVTGQQIIVPNEPTFLPDYAHQAAHGLSNDWTFIEEALRRAPRDGYGVKLWSQKIAHVEVNGGRMF